MNDFQRIYNANIDDLYLRDIGFVPSGRKRNSGACPLHNGEKKDKFTFIESQGRRIYTCWTDGCVRGADIIEVCRVREHLAERIDAVRFLADKYGIELNSYKKKDLSEEEKKALEEKRALAQKKKNNLYKTKLAYDRALKMRNVEQALSLAFLEDKIKYNKTDEYIEEELEQVNYSNYVANNKYEVSKYLSEHESGMINALLSASAGSIEALFAPTGSGKTRLLAHLLKRLGLKALIILPLQSNVEQFVRTYHWCDGAWGKRSIKKPFKNKSQIIVMTWDKAAQLAKDNEIDLSDYILVADEIHQTYIDIFRSEAISGFFRLCKKVKGRLDITATPNKLDFTIYDNITEYKQLIQTNYSVTLYNSGDISKVIDIANKSDKFAILMNDTKTLNYITEKVNKKCTVIYSDNKDKNPVYEQIVESGKLGDIQGLCNTAVIVAGVNIYDLDLTDVIVFNVSDIATVRQYVARFRENEYINVHIFKRFKEESKVYLVENLIDEEILQAQALADNYTLIAKTHTTLNVVSEAILSDSLKAIGLGAFIYFNEETQRYEVNEFAIRARVYQTYYNTRTIEQYKILLEEYFDNITIFDEKASTVDDVKNSIETAKELKAYKQMLEENKINALELLEEHKDILVGYDKIIKDDFVELFEYIYTKGYDLKQIKDLYRDLNIEQIVIENKLTDILERYSKFVLERNLSTDVSWKLATMGAKARKSYFKKLDILAYRELRFNYDNVINISLVENQIYDFIVENFGIGTTYTDDHIVELLNDIENKFGKNKAFSKVKLATILKNIYEINKDNQVAVEKISHLNCNFYRNIMPKYEISQKRVRLSIVENYMTIDCIKKELAVTSSDDSLDKYLSRLINSHLARFGLSTSDAKFIEVDFIDIF